MAQRKQLVFANSDRKRYSFPIKRLFKTYIMI